MIKPQNIADISVSPCVECTKKVYGCYCKDFQDYLKSYLDGVEPSEPAKSVNEPKRGAKKVTFVTNNIKNI